jgi:Transposase IS66 family
VPRQKLEEFQGTIQTDAYEVYSALGRKNSAVQRIGCLAHSRRRFYQALKESVSEAVWFIVQIRQLYRLEDQTFGSVGEIRVIWAVLDDFRYNLCTNFLVRRLQPAGSGKSGRNRGPIFAAHDETMAARPVTGGIVAFPPGGMSQNRIGLP